MTATASQTMRKRICAKLGSTKATLTEVVECPDRANVKLSILKYAASCQLYKIFENVIDLLRTEGSACKRMLIFCQSIPDCGRIYAMFVSNVPQSCLQYVEMYHSKTWSDLQQKILRDMSTVDGHVRILVCTSAVGMGVNFCDINYVINFGPPRKMDDMLQQLGRAGRCGDQAYHVVVHTPRQHRGVDSEVLDYMKSTKRYRQQLMACYGGLPDDYEIVGHFCCDICAVNCNCGHDECEMNRCHPLFSLSKHNGDEVDNVDSK